MTKNLCRGNGFGIKIEGIKEEEIKLRIWRERSIDLRIIDVKVFCGGKAISVPKVPSNIVFHDNHGIIYINPNNVNCTECTAITFQIKNKADRKQYKCELDLCKTSTGDMGCHCEEITYNGQMFGR